MPHHDDRTGSLKNAAIGGAKLMVQKAVSVLFLCAAVMAQNSPTQLEVTSSNLDINSHQITVTLVNRGSETVVTYTLQIHQFDGSGKRLDVIPLVVTIDHVFDLMYANEPDLSRYGFVRPGASFVNQFGSLPDAVSASATVIAVVYKDRTAEGDPKQVALIFRNRAMHAEHATNAANLLANYPSSPSEVRDRLDKLTALHEHTLSVAHLLKGQGTDQQQWNAAAAEERALASLLTVQSKEATK